MPIRRTSAALLFPLALLVGGCETTTTTTPTVNSQGDVITQPLSRTLPKLKNNPKQRSNRNLVPAGES